MCNQIVCWFLYGRGPQPLVRSPVPVGPKLEAGALGVLNPSLAVRNQFTLQPGQAGLCICS